jgi:phosphoglycerate dehydrogenase-like enzyme
MGEVLPVTDILVSVLPATADTLEVANRQIFDALPTHAWFVNVGRGSVVNEDDLVAALHSGSLGGAALDVTDREPLPDSSPLWDAPNLILTPHAAGGRPEGVGEFLSTNIEVFHAGGTPANLVA